VIANLENLSVTVDFPMQIENIVRKKRIGYIEAIEIWCIQNGKDIIVGGDLAKRSPVIREKVRAEAEDLHFLPRSAKLPL
jgi:hypothetical protein